MTSNRRTAAPVAVLGIAALALSACGGTDDGDGVGAVEVGTEAATDSGTTVTDDTADDTTSTTSTTTEAGPDTAASPTGDADAGAAAGLPPRPERDRCVDVPEAPDGVYTVYEAGTATVTVADGRLTLVDVQAADGWTSRVDDEDDDEVEIDFRSDASDDVLDLEVEVDDGRVEVQICNDDD